MVMALPARRHWPVGRQRLLAPLEMNEPPAAWGGSGSVWVPRSLPRGQFGRRPERTALD